VSQPITLAGLAVAAAAATYALACAASPFGPCWRCGDDLHRRADCRRCDYTGRRIRTGRRLWTYLRRLYTDAH
jgi:hypothetical protein